MNDDLPLMPAWPPLLALVLAIWSAGCSKDNVKIEYVERLVETQVPLEPRLLAVPDAVPAPPFDCTDTRGAKTVCTEDAIDWGARWEKVGRDLIKQIKAIKGLQPAEGG